ncbi:glycosyltransferase [Paenibacillus sp. LMG 31459]|uniref:Glycosyltransferase n=1 Tax=Paenibacillus phytohabitans TaxID=2654978 RepID=A0ABX1YH92_9BACL|nr:glycosyltransferase [Paenibacillus phytohabitans]NOU79238.1 glycosyltransferase [Paenibacillus phytohabitans]
MDINKVCFITCLDDEIQHEESVRYIRSLNIPEDFQIEVIAVRDAEGMAVGYNRAMIQSNAKYKVYLHQDVFIVNPNFISDILLLFSKNPKLALIGVKGGAEIPPSGLWWEAADLYGKIYESSKDNRMQLCLHNEVASDYESVEAVDGLILITQYDLAWRDDLMKGWHMYDTAQCLEFKRRGYEVGVPYQIAPWVIHDSGPLSFEGFEQGRLAFLNEYSKDIHPLVSILIPAYNRPYYLELALQSAICQSYKNIEIIIGDDSTNDEVQKVIAPYLEMYDNIIYHKNPENLGIGNWHKLYELANGEYINYLMDDDLFCYEKIEKMVQVFQLNKNISLVTSFRELIDHNGEHIPSRPSTRKLFEKDNLINGKQFGSMLLSQIWNAVGEPTTAMFRKKDITQFGYFHGESYTFLNDFASWISLMELGDVMYLSEPLSYFRQHGEQNQLNPKYKILTNSEWFNLIFESKKHGFLKEERMYKEAISNYIKLVLDNITFFRDLNLENMLTEKLTDNYLSRAIEELLT